MPFWPFRRRQAAEPTPPAELPSTLDSIDEATPHRFRFWLSNSAQRDAAFSTLSTAREDLDIKVLSEPDGRVGLEVASTFSPRTAAVLRPLYLLDRVGIAVRSFEALDLVTELDESALTRAVAAWGRFGNNGPYRHRLEVLAGHELIETCLGHLRIAASPQHGSEPLRPAVWRLATSCVACNTPGSEARILRAAVEAGDDLDAQALVDSAIHRATLTTLTGEPFDPPEDALVALIGRRSYLGERATFVPQSMKAPLPEPVTQALCAAARAGGDRGASALAALDKAAPSASVRQVEEDSLASAEPNLQATALGILAHHWGEEARPIWQGFLASRSAPLRQTAEAVLGLHGTAEDLPEAAARLAKLSRTKPAVYMSPPLGCEIVDLLVRHRDRPAARAGLDDLSARWDRLSDDLREWLEQNHAWLDPSHRPDEPVEQDAEPEEPLEWPPPTIERDGDTFVLWFEETDLFETRERFEEFAEAHPAVQAIDGDREWLSLTISREEPEALIRELWAAAGPRRSSG
ncbi:MAG: hypothetical protein H0X16_10915 [Chloroflexi bacterium]|nr:hypothetical protein [Chloroflexota bacterium]